MRYSAEHKGQVRAKLLDIAAEQVRKSGIPSLSVNSLMEAAGMTHGGFYVHFKSKDDLIAATIDHMFDRMVNFLASLRARHGEGAFEAYIAYYLSAKHRDDGVGGCPLPALSSEMRYAPESAREAYERGLVRLATRLAEMLPGGQVADMVVLMGQMAGTIVMARSLQTKKLSNAVLRQAANTLKAA